MARGRVGRRVHRGAAVAVALALGIVGGLAPGARAFLDFGELQPGNQPPGPVVAQGRILGAAEGTPFFFIDVRNDYTDFNEPSRCSDAFDCGGWLAAGCPNVAPAGMDPAVTASIMDVRSFAGDGRTHALGLSSSEGWDQFGVAVQFWTGACSEVTVPWVSPSYHTSTRLDITHPAYFVIPSDVRWMTITGVQSVDVNWMLH